MRRGLIAFTQLLCLLSLAAICALTSACTTSISGMDNSNNSNQIGPPVQLKFQTEPSTSASAGINFGTMPVAQIEDSNGNVVTSATEAVTLIAYTDSTCTTMAPGTFVVTNNTLTPTSGVASFTGVNYGGSTTTIYIGASASGLTSACSSAVTITPGTPTKLIFATEPSSTAGAGIAFSTQPVVAVEDAYGNVVTSASNTVTIASYSDNICTTSATGTLSATTNPLTPTSGDATFAGVNYGGTSSTTVYIGASSSGLTSACSSSVSITPGNPAKLVYSTEPADPSATAGVNLATQPVVTVEDTYGNVVTSATNAVTLAAYTNSACSSTGSGTFNATTNPVTPSSGISTFAGVNYTKSGTFYVGASSSGLTSACSNAINVAAGPPAQLAMKISWGLITENVCNSDYVYVEDQYGNTATVSGSAYTVALVAASGSMGIYSDSACSSALSSTTISVGQSDTPSFYINDTVVENSSWYASATGLTSTPTDNLTWYLVPYLSFSPSTFAAGACVPFTITLEDAKGNVMSIPDTESAALIDFGYGSTYADSSCSTAVSITDLSIPSGQTTITYYFSDARAGDSPAGYIKTNYTGGRFLGSGPNASLTITAGTPDTLILTGPTFEAPGTCAGPYTATTTDANHNPSNITGSALTANLAASGSAQVFSDSGCTSPTTSISIAIGSGSQTFYAEDSATEISTITASATSYTSGTFNLDSISASPLQQVAVIANSSTCVLINGGVKCWGVNNNGQLGNGTTTNSFTPVTVSGLSSGVTQLAATQYGICALKSDNTIWCWGYAGNLPGGTTPSELTISGTPLLATQISAGEAEVCAVTASGALYCGGSGYPNSTMTELLSSGATSVAATHFGSCVILAGGDLKCWGDNSDGEVGIGTTGGTYATPQQVIGLTTGVSSTGVSVGAACAIVSGAVSCWGDSSDGEANGGTPAAVGAPLTSGVASVIGGGGCNGCNEALFAVTTSGALYGWGAAENANHGIFANNGTTGYSYTSPHEIFSSGAQSAAIGMDGWNGWLACAIVSGNLECWSENGYGELGNGTRADSYVAVYPQSLE